jgi:hypothetical protein
MWIGLAVGVLVGSAQAIKSFRSPHDPEPPNSRIKLPFMLLLLAVCIAFAANGVGPIAFSVLAAVCATEVCFILAGRNPWWTQAPMDKREYVRYKSAPLHDRPERVTIRSIIGAAAIVIGSPAASAGAWELVQVGPRERLLKCATDGEHAKPRPSITGRLGARWTSRSRTCVSN